MLNLKYVKLIILVLEILFLCNFCNEPPFKKKKESLIPPGFDLIFYFGTLSWGSKETGTVVDNKDGTLTYTYTLIQTNPYFGNRVLSQKTILIRRCLIGQVYRSAQNDCQGTGTKATIWGASQLQWCPTNDRSCEKDGKADPAISPAAKACADDAFAGKTWALPSKDDGLSSFLNTPNQLILNDYRRVSGYILFWSNEASFDDRVFSPFSPGSSIAEKKSQLNVLCIGAGV